MDAYDSETWSAGNRNASILTPEALLKCHLFKGKIAYVFTVGDG